MASACTCDGCGAVIPGAPAKIGHEIKNDYCENCAPAAKQMLEDIDALHDKVAQMWETELEIIKKMARDKLKVIPDERPD